MENRHEITSTTGIATFIFGGHALFTVVSRSTGARFTYKVRQGKEDASPYFVSVLSGPNNGKDYRYLGTIFPNRTNELTMTKASTAGSDAPSVKAFRWLLKCVEAEKTSSIEFWHEGRCARCGRVLTVPESLAAGIGPVCAAA